MYNLKLFYDMILLFHRLSFIHSWIHTIASLDVTLD